MPALASAPEPDAELARLEALGSYNVLDTPPEERFDRIARLAAKLMDAPFAMVSLLDANRAWFKARFGAEMTEASNESAFCRHALTLSEALVIEDTRTDPRSAANPLVTGDPHIRFYAGAQLRGRDGYVLGTLCVLDTRPRTPTADAIASLEDLACGAVAELELRRATVRLNEKLAEQRKLAAALEMSRSIVEESGARLQDFLAATPDLLWETDALHRLQPASSSAALNRYVGEMIGASLLDVARGSLNGEAAAGRLQDRLDRRESFRQLEFAMPSPHGDPLWFEASGKPVYVSGVFQGYRGLLRDISARKLAEESLRRLSEEDALTGLPNRRTFDRRLQEVGSDDAPGALLMLDIDRFKLVNDTYGHPVGDRLIEELSARLATLVRKDDTVARLGGDEFAIVLRRIPGEAVAGVARRICAAASEPFFLGEAVLQVSLSLGAVLVPSHGFDARTAFKLADEALYDSKRAGRGCWTLHGRGAQELCGSALF